MNIFQENVLANSQPFFLVSVALNTLEKGQDGILQMQNNLQIKSQGAEACTSLIFNPHRTT